LYSMMAFSAAKLTVAWVTPFSFESPFSIARAQLMQLMPPMLSVIFLVFSWLVELALPCDGCMLFHGVAFDINVSEKDISLSRQTKPKQPQQNNQNRNHNSRHKKPHSNRIKPVGVQLSSRL
jgi:hypothetical protein